MGTGEQSGAKRLLASIDAYLAAYAENIELAAQGHKTKFELDDTTTTKVLKMVDQAHNIEVFNKILSGEHVFSEVKKGRPKAVEPEVEVTETSTETSYKITGNAFEERSKAVLSKKAS